VRVLSDLELYVPANHSWIHKPVEFVAMALPIIVVLVHIEPEVHVRAKHQVIRRPVQVALEEVLHGTVVLGLTALERLALEPEETLKPV